MVCDSTNVFVEGEAGSEATVRANLEKLVRTRKSRVAVTCFASNLARVESIAKAAIAAGRHPVLAGRALQRMVEAAQECGYLLDFPPCVDERQAGYLPRDKVLFICTGSQGRGPRHHGQARQQRPPGPGAWSKATRRSSPRGSFRATSARSADCRTP